jgi:uncharacterized protein YegP (UPF0339 family)
MHFESHCRHSRAGALYAGTLKTGKTGPQAPAGRPAQCAPAHRAARIVGVSSSWKGSAPNAGLSNRGQPKEGMNMSGYFELHKSSNEKFVFNLKADNNEIILTSQIYSTKQHALDGIESVRHNSPEDAHYIRKHSIANEPYFVLNAINGETIGSSQMYSSGSAMEGGISSVKANGATKTAKDHA